MEAWQAILISIASTLGAAAIWKAATVGMALNLTVKLMLQRLQQMEQNQSTAALDIKELFRLHRRVKSGKITAKTTKPQEGEV